MVAMQESMPVFKKAAVVGVLLIASIPFEVFILFYPWLLIWLL